MMRSLIIGSLIRTVNDIVILFLMIRTQYVEFFWTPVKIGGLC